MKLNHPALRFVNLMPPKGVVARWRLRGNTRYGKFHMVPDPSLSGKAICGTAGEWADPVQTVTDTRTACLRCFRFTRDNAHNVIQEAR